MELKYAGIGLILLGAASCMWADPPAPPPASPPAPQGAATQPGASIGWRYDGTGRLPGAQPVATWSAKKNILWSTKVGSSFSSPIVVQGKVFLTSEPNLLICLDAESGKELWRKEHKFSDLPPELNAKDPEMSAQAGNAAPTPVSDGKYVYFYLGDGIVAAYDLNGQRRWIKWYDLPQTTSDGRASSPLLIGDKLLIHFGPLVCLDAKTGAILWQNKDADAGYGTPALTRIGGADVVVTPKGSIVRVSDGATVASDVGSSGYTSPLVDKGVAYFIDTSASAALLPEKAEEDPKLEAAFPVKTKDLWQTDLEGDFFSSPVLYEGKIYAVNKDAMYFVIDAKTGKVLDKEALPILPKGQGGAGDQSVMVYPSIVLAGKQLLISNNGGEAVLIDPNVGSKDAAVNDIGDGAAGTPAPVGKKLYLRAGEKIYCIGSK